MSLFIFTFEPLLILWGSWQGINQTVCLLPACEVFWLFPLHMQWNCTALFVSLMQLEMQKIQVFIKFSSGNCFGLWSFQNMMSQQCIQCLCPRSSFLWLGWVWPGLHCIQRCDCGVFKTLLVLISGLKRFVLIYPMSVKINAQSRGNVRALNLLHRGVRHTSARRCSNTHTNQLAVPPWEHTFLGRKKKKKRNYNNSINREVYFPSQQIWYTPLCVYECVQDSF